MGSYKAPSQIRGQLSELPAKRDGMKDGKMWVQAKFRVVDKTEKDWACIAWGETADKAVKQLTEVGMRVVVEGHVEGGFEITVRGFVIPGARKSWRDILLKHYGGERGLAHAKADFEKDMEAQGRVKTVRTEDGQEIVVYLPESETIHYQGTRYSKLEFVMDVLGAEYVSKEIRAFTSTLPKKEYTKGALERVGTLGTREKYLEKLEELYNQACHYLESNGPNSLGDGYEYDENE